MKKQMLEAVRNSISEVMETMFYLPVEFAAKPDEKRVNSLRDKTCLSCRIGFSGDISGSMTLLAPRDLVAEMAENFMGEPAGTLGREVLEGTLTEALNMICGNALRKLPASRPFELSIPEPVAVPDFPQTGDFLLIDTLSWPMALHVAKE